MVDRSRLCRATLVAVALVAVQRVASECTPLPCIRNLGYPGNDLRLRVVTVSVGVDNRPRSPWARVHLFPTCSVRR